MNSQKCELYEIFLSELLSSEKRILRATDSKKEKKNFLHIAKIQ